MTIAYAEAADPALALLALLRETTPVTQYSLTEQLRRDWGESEETEIYLDYLQETAETIELFMKKIGPQRTAEIIFAVLSQKRLEYGLSRFDDGG